MSCETRERIIELAKKIKGGTASELEKSEFQRLRPYHSGCAKKALEDLESYDEATSS